MCTSTKDTCGLRRFAESSVGVAKLLLKIVQDMCQRQRSRIRVFLFSAIAKVFGPVALFVGLDFQITLFSPRAGGKATTSNDIPLRIL